MPTWPRSSLNKGVPERPGDAEIATLALRQHGVVAHYQLAELGFSPKRIEYRLRARRLHRLRRGVYAVGHTALGAHGRLMAGVLAYGPRAVASHHSAGWLWELRPPGTADVHVTVPGRARHAQDGIRLHCVRSLSCEDAAVREAVPVTTVSRTLLDLAEALGPRQLRRLVEDAERLRLFDRFAIDDLCERSRGRRGVRALRAVLADRIEPAPTRSELERRFLELCRDADLPAPSVNAGVLGYEVDALWPERRVVVELDSYGFHRARSAFEQDRLRDAALQVAGYRVLRITDRRLRTGARAVVQEVRSLLEPQG